MGDEPLDLSLPKSIKTPLSLSIQIERATKKRPLQLPQKQSGAAQLREELAGAKKRRLSPSDSPSTSRSVTQPNPAADTTSGKQFLTKELDRRSDQRSVENSAPLKRKASFWRPWDAESEDNGKPKRPRRRSPSLSKDQTKPSASLETEATQQPSSSRESAQLSDQEDDPPSAIPATLSPSGDRLRHQIPGFDPRPFFELVEKKELRFKGGVIVEKGWQVKLVQQIPGTAEEQLRKVLAILQFALDGVISRADPELTAQLFISHPNIYTDTRASRRLKAKDLDLDEIMNRLEEIIQSSKVGRRDGDESDEDGGGGEVGLEDCEFTLVTFRPRGVGSLHSRKDVAVEDYLSKSIAFMDPSKKSYRLPKNLRNSCLLNCVALGLARTDMKDSLKGAKMMSFVRQELDQRVSALAASAGVEKVGPHPLFTLEKIQQSLGDDYQICVYNTAGPPLASFGSNTAQHVISLMLLVSEEGGVRWSEDGEAPCPAHVVLITSMTAFFGTRFFCQLCKAGHRSRRHRCQESTCKICRQPACQNKQESSARFYRRCEDCGVAWPTELCFAAHRCGNTRRCLVCWELCQKNNFEEHKYNCGRPFCKLCKNHHLPFENCYVPTERKGPGPTNAELWASSDEEGEEFRPPSLKDQPAPPTVSSSEEEEVPGRKKRKKKPKKIRPRCFGDIETREVPGTRDHKAILIIIKKKTDGVVKPETFYFSGESAMSDFVEACIKENSPFKDCVITFHNLAGFDGQLIHSQLMQMNLKCAPLLKGQKIINMRIPQNNVTFRDSLLFLPGTPLSKFESMFNLTCGSKGYYPYKLQGTKHVDFEKFPDYHGNDGGRFPPLEDFGLEGLRPKALAKLSQWHSEKLTLFSHNPELRYNATEELIRYCEQDVELLMQGFEIYRSRWLSQYPDMDVTEFLTFPQFSNTLYRRHFMKSQSICPLPPQGFDSNSSVEAFCWMQMMRKRLREAGTPLTNVKDARRGSEVRLGGVRVDGWGEDAEGRRHVFQYHGCRWHGCPTCLGKKKRTAEQEAAYARTLEQSARLKALSTNPDSPYGPFVYHEIWSHDFYNQVKFGTAKAYWRKFKKNWPKEALGIRYAFFGGRTNPIAHKIRVKKGWRIVYVDFTSLYPSINYGAKNELYPVGFPKIFIGADMEEEPDVPSLDEAFGFWKVRVHPPRRLLHPVLPQVFNGKLIFALCRTCAEEETQGPCFHAKEERSIHGTFFTEELKKAVEMGYELETPEEIYEWPREQRTKKLFRKYIRRLYAQKILSSAAPEDPEEMEKHLEEQRLSVKLRLDPKDFKRDECLRTLAKFSLNNIWGYHGKKGAPAKQIWTTSETEIYKIVNDPTVEVTAMRLLMDGKMVRVDYKEKVEATYRSGSIAIAAMTTGWARLRLYEVIQAFPKEIIYFDTDSAFLLLPPGKEGPKTSSMLGDLKDELKENFCPGAYISSFTSLGPKTYTYDVRDGSGKLIHREMKAKGISLSAAALEVVTAEAMAELVEEPAKALRVPQFLISRDLLKARLYSANLFKRFAFSSTKRFFVPEPNETKTTLPFGFGADEDKEEQLDQLIAALEEALNQ